ncbi:hypothetical protein [Ahrensia marina]|jgi:hypothetical protein|uniref:Uncharacterized protein n=1 Tax=Ahrensia marina TaxID=1514904 RepID=A0A0M9GP17_9HYPH|nr:hypothetical protein [Ahrensia marina]KPB02049.1 hypothetical protein SU32_04590 [Ahrensia marina]
MADELLSTKSALGIVADDSLSRDEKETALLQLREEITSQQSDGTLDPGLASRALQDIQVAMARIDE